MGLGGAPDVAHVLHRLFTPAGVVGPAGPTKAQRALHIRGPAMAADQHTSYNACFSLDNLWTNRAYFLFHTVFTPGPYLSGWPVWKQHSASTW